MYYLPLLQAVDPTFYIGWLCRHHNGCRPNLRRCPRHIFAQHCRLCLHHLLPRRDCLSHVRAWLKDVLQSKTLVQLCGFRHCPRHHCLYHHLLLLWVEGHKCGKTWVSIVYSTMYHNMSNAHADCRTQQKSVFCHFSAPLRKPHRAKITFRLPAFLSSYVRFDSWELSE